MKEILMIAAGGSLGAVSRFGLSRCIYRMTGALFPIGTMTINLIGCFLIGFFFDLFDRAVVPGEIKSFVTIGFIGAFTTFSTYSMETFNLLRDGEIRFGVINILVSNIFGLVAVVLGIAASGVVFRIIR